MSVSNLRSTAAAVRTAARSTAAQTAQTTFEIAVATGSIDSMQALSESFTRKIEVERRRGEDLRNRLKVLLAKLAKLHALEHRLNKLTEKQNHTETCNVSMRQEVDDCRRKKLQQRRIRQAVEADISKTKRALVTVLQSLRQSVSGRDRFQRDAQVLQGTIEREMEEFELEFKHRVDELTAEKPPVLLEGRDADRHTLVDASEPVRAASPVSKARGSQSVLHWASSESALEMGSTAQASLTAAEAEDSIRHKSTRVCWEISRQEVDLRKQAALLASYSDAFRKIQSDTGISTVEDMTSEFLFAEERNFSLINMINDLNKDVELLESETTYIKAAVASAKEFGRQSEASKSAVFQGLDAQALELERKAQAFQRKHEQMVSFMDALKPYLVSVLQKVLPTSASGADQLSESVISEGNIMAFMALLEHRVTELVQMVHASKVGYSLTHASPGNASLDAHSSDAQRLLSKVLASSVTIGTSKSSVAAPARLPSIGDSDSEDESIVFGVGPAAFRASSVRPVSLEHLKFTAAKALERRKAKLTAELDHMKIKY